MPGRVLAIRRCRVLIGSRMKSSRTFLFVLAVLFAPFVAAAVDISVNPLSPPNGFHPVFTGVTVTSFTTDTGPTNAAFTVTVGQSYPVTQIVGGTPTQVGTVVFDAGGVPTFTPL